MNRFPIGLSIVVTISIVLSLSPNADAQMPPSSSTTSTPIPGAGHDYLGEIAETVNPVNGSVSIRLNAMMPPGRGLTLPFSFAYDSNGVNFVGQNSGGNLSWLNPPTTLTSQGGWSNSAPSVSFNEITWTAISEEGHHQACHGFVGYVYQDASGNRHNLNLTNFWDPSGVCASDSADWPTGFGADIVTQGGEGPILASIPTSGLYGYPVTVADADGTVLQFSGIVAEQPNGGLVGLAGSIEDRNGNLVTVTGPTGTANAYNYIDTAGRTVLQDSGFAVSPETITVSGLNTPYTLQWTTLSTPTFTAPVTVISGTACNFGGSHQPWVVGPQGLAEQGLSTLTLPNGKSFSFTYDSTYKVINKMTYPTGGYVRYVWGMNPQAESGSNHNSQPNDQCEALYGLPVITDRYVSFTGSTEVQHQHFAYSTAWTGGSWTSKQTTVTTTDLVRGTSYNTIYTYIGLAAEVPPNTLSGPTTDDPVEASIAYYDVTGTLLKTVAKTWKDVRLLASQTTTYPNSEATKTAWSYNAREQQIEKDDYDFSTSTPPLLRKTVTNYQQFNLNLYPGAQTIADRPCQIITYDSTGTNRVAETDYFYDNGATTTPCGTAGTPSLTGAGGGSLTGHDETNYASTSTTPRGNLTQKTQWVSSGTAPVTKYSYDETGQILSMIDPCGNATCSDMTGTTHTTSYSYADSFLSTNSAGFTTTAGSPPTGKVTNAYLTTITQPATSGVAHFEQFAYGYNDGEVTQMTDENSQPTKYEYNDSLGRLTETVYPDTGATTLSYNDTIPSVTTTKLINGTENLVTIAVMDGLGHVVQTELASDPKPTYTQTAYDGLDRKYQVYNPTRCSPPTTNCGESTWGVTTYAYDALGRVLSVTNPDSSVASTSYTGRATEVSDEGNGTHSVQRISQVDGLGRLTNVCEVTSTTLVGITPTPTTCSLDITPATGFLTSYQYDALSNLKSVTQGGLNGRSFTYDSLSRLLTATNPESGEMQYSYDANGNLYQRTSPKLNQSGQPTVTTYAYDVLNRLTGKTYNDTTPSATFQYDESTAWGQTLLNPIGRLTQTRADNGLADAIFSYDPMGRLVTQFQCTPLTCGTTSIVFFFGYDLLGDLTSSYNDGDNITYTNSYDAAARLTSVQSNLSDSQHPGTLITLSNFTPFQKPQQVTLGNGIVETLSYTNRNQAESVSESPNIYGYSIWNSVGSTVGYAPNGNILYSNDLVNGNWSYTYNDLNQLTIGSCSTDCPPTGGLKYTYDRFGNRWQETVTAGTGIQPSYTFDANNHINTSGVTYDGAGNILYDGVGLGNTYTYDAENRIITAANGSYAASYVYDAEGHRVRATVNGQTRDFLYDLSGRTIDAFVPGGAYWLGTWLRGEAYAGGLHIATYANSTTEFDNSDWLNTFRARSDVLGNKIETCTNMPFGEDLTCTGSGSNPEASPIHFTGKERDSESGLDMFGARYYASTMGRFMTPDWAARPTSVPYAVFGDPQSLNLYNYVRSDPVTRADADGHMTQYITCGSDSQHCNPLAGDGKKPEQKQGCKYDACVTAQAPKKSIWELIGGWFGGTAFGFVRWGKLGGPLHREAVARVARSLRESGFEVEKEVRIPTPNGAKSSRWVDVVGTRGSETRMYQIGRQNLDGTPVAREAQALDDIEGATGIRPNFVPYNFGEPNFSVPGATDIAPGEGEVPVEPEIIPE
jgi:RHS repeat-associated protein